MTRTYPPSFTVTGVDPLSQQQPSLLMTLSSLSTDTLSPYHMTVTDARSETGGIWVPVVRDICLSYSILIFETTLAEGATVQLDIVYKTGVDGDVTTMEYSPTITQERLPAGDIELAPMYLFQTSLTLKKGDLVRCDVRTSTNPATFKQVSIYGTIPQDLSNVSEGPLQMHTFSTNNTVSTTRCLFDSGTQHILIPRRTIGIESVGAVIGVGNTGFSADWSIALTFQAYTIADDNTLTATGSSKEITFSGTGREASDPDVTEILPLNYTIDASSGTHFLRVSYVKTGITDSSNHLMFSFMYGTQNLDSAEIRKENLQLNEHPRTVLPETIGLKARFLTDSARVDVNTTIPPSSFTLPRAYFFTSSAYSGTEPRLVTILSRNYGEIDTVEGEILTLATSPISAPADGELNALIVELPKTIYVPVPGLLSYVNMAGIHQSVTDIIELRSANITQPLST